MATKYFATLQFEANGPTVEGELADGTTARRAYRDCIGLYGSNPGVVIRLIEETDGRRRVRMSTTEPNLPIPAPAELAPAGTDFDDDVLAKLAELEKCSAQHEINLRPQHAAWLRPRQRAPVSARCRLTRGRTGTRRIRLVKRLIQCVPRQCAYLCACS
jgi:hypothetical protein